MKSICHLYLCNTFRILLRYTVYSALALTPLINNKDSIDLITYLFSTTTTTTTTTTTITVSNLLFLFVNLVPNEIVQEIHYI